MIKTFRAMTFPVLRSSTPGARRSPPDRAPAQPGSIRHFVWPKGTGFAGGFQLENAGPEPARRISSMFGFQKADNDFQVELDVLLFFFPLENGGQ
jgi:hypothetical protein